MLQLYTRTDLTLFIMINQIIKIDSMTNILAYKMQCRMSTSGKQISIFFPPFSAEEDHLLHVYEPEGHSPPLTIPLSLDGVTSYFLKHKTLALLNMEMNQCLDITSAWILGCLSLAFLSPRE